MTDAFNTPSKLGPKLGIALGLLLGLGLPVAASQADSEPPAQRLAQAQPGATGLSLNRQQRLLIQNYQEQGVVAPTAKERRLIKDIERYLRNIRTGSASFTQFVNGQASSKGTFHLQRPNRMRLQYEYPPIALIADGSRYIYHDAEMDQVTYLGLDDFPYGFLLQDRPDLSKSNLRLSVAEDERAIYLKSEDPEGNTPATTFVFTKQPMQLSHWFYTDQTGVQTLVQLTNFKLNQSLDPKLFRFQNPNFR